MTTERGQISFFFVLIAIALSLLFLGILNLIADYEITVVPKTATARFAEYLPTFIARLTVTP